MTPAEVTEKVQEKKESKDKQPPVVKNTVETKLDTTKLQTEVKKETPELTAEQLALKDEFEKDIASGIKVSAAMDKYATKMDKRDPWIGLIPFLGDAASSSAGLLFFMTQNAKMAKKYKLPVADKIKVALLQGGDMALTTLVKTPLNAIMSIPVLGWLAAPILRPVNALVGFTVDKVFKANKYSAKCFKKSFDQMLADANKWNKDNPDKPQIDVSGMEQEIKDNMKKFTTISSKDKTGKSPTQKEKDKTAKTTEEKKETPTTANEVTPETIVTAEEKGKNPPTTETQSTETKPNTTTTNPNITSVNYEYVDKK